MSEQIQAVVSALETIIVGKRTQIELAIACLLSRGHLLVEDLPGMGKTTLSHALAKVVGLSFQRVQFTSDMLPADVVGVTVFKAKDDSFAFHPGPIFTQVLLADEINRAPPKTQGALLEAMEEKQVTIDGQTHPLPEPFFVIATQNPTTQIGTYPLPESQLDRFLLRLQMGYPSPAVERELLKRGDSRPLFQRLEPAISPMDLDVLQTEVDGIRVSDAVIDYVQRVVQATRNDQVFEVGLSPRAALGLIRVSQAWAFIQGRSYVIPEDVQAMLVPLASHRLVVKHHDRHDASCVTHLKHIIDTVDVLSKAS